jgi:hypothetical protein
MLYPEANPQPRLCRQWTALFAPRNLRFIMKRSADTETPTPLLLRANRARDGAVIVAALDRRSD